MVIIHGCILENSDPPFLVIHGDDIYAYVLHTSRCNEFPKYAKFRNV